MLSFEQIKSHIYINIFKLIGDSSVVVNDDMPLIGNDGVLDSMKLVELCLMLEDNATEIGFEFDWTSDAAMSRSRSMFRTAGSLTEEFISQMRIKK